MANGEKAVCPFIAEPRPNNSSRYAISIALCKPSVVALYLLLFDANTLYTHCHYFFFNRQDFDDNERWTKTEYLKLIHADFYGIYPMSKSSEIHLEMKF